MSSPEAETIISFTFKPRVNQGRFARPVRSAIPPFTIGKWSTFHETTELIDQDEAYLRINFGVIAVGARQSIVFTVLPILEGKRDATCWRFPRVFGADLSTLRKEHGTSQIALIDTKYYSDTLTVHLSIKTLRVATASSPARPSPRPSHVAIEMSSAHINSRHPNDVRLLFPGGRDLWGSSGVLSRSSPYFKTVLSSPLVPNSTRPRSLRPLHTPSLDFDDSDAEDISAPEHTPSPSPPTPYDVPHHQIEVTSGSYKTYRAVLTWIMSNEIEFASLKSSHLPSPTTTIRGGVARCPPPSPKSVFCLASFLEIPALANLALTNFQSQLTVNNVVYELFGDVAQRHEEIREICLRFAASNWPAVERSPAFSKVQMRTGGGRSSKYSSTLFRLSQMVT